MKVLEQVCEKCGKVLSSLYEKQLEFNYKSHLATHDNTSTRKEEKKNGNEYVWKDEDASKDT